MSDESRRIANHYEGEHEKKTSTREGTETRSCRKRSEDTLRLSTREFEYLQKIMSAYSDNAKTYNQVSMAALFLPIVFLQKVLGTQEGNPLRPPWPMVVSWVLFLVSIGAGLLYQLLAVKYLEREMDGWGEYTGPFCKLRETLDSQPGYVYDVMILTFYLASCAFVIGALKANEILGPKTTAYIFAVTTLGLLVIVAWWAELLPKRK